MIKHWVPVATGWLKQSLEPVPQEINELDWKSELSPKKERLTEHLIAFANHPNGGFLVFGVEDSGNLLGMKQNDVKQIINTITSLGRDAIDPPLAIDNATVEYDGIHLLIVHIPEQANKPVRCRGKSIEETWIRSGGTTRKASRQDIGSMMLNSQVSHWETLRASALLDGTSLIAKFDLSVIASLLQRPLPAEEGELLRWLTDEKMITPVNDGYYITNFGAIAAARKLEQFDTLKRKCIRVIRYQGKNKTATIDEVVGHKGYAVGFEGLIGYLKRVLPHSEVIEQSLRTEVCIYPEIALRELVANALIHQDFSITGSSPMIDIYDDRVEFTNPGSLLPGKRLDRLIGATPESRNEILASAFRRYRICEERGTGFQKTVASIELFGLPPVVFTSLENAFKVTLYAPKKFDDMTQTERIEACYQHAVLQHLSNQTVTNTTTRKRFKLHEKHRTVVSNLLREVAEKGRIKRKDPDAKSSKFVEYVPYWA